MIIRNGKIVEPSSKEKEAKKAKETKNQEPNYWGGDLYKKKK
jgi:hypothetical protein